jgi:hypothetical protein
VVIGGDMGEQVTRVPVQQPPPGVASAPAKPPFWYRYRAGVGALLLVNLGIGGLFANSLGNFGGN